MFGYEIVAGMQVTRVSLSHIYIYIYVCVCECVCVYSVIIGAHLLSVRIIICIDLIKTTMPYILLFLLFGLSTMIYTESLTKIDRVKEHLQSSARRLSITTFLELPNAASYLNHDLTQNSPHRMNLSEELTMTIREWSPRLLALDPTCPYYFSKYINVSSSRQDLNLLSYLQAS